MHTMRHSCSWEPTVECSPKSPAQKLVQFDLPNLDDLGDALQLPTDLAGFLEWPEDATTE